MDDFKNYPKDAFKEAAQKMADVKDEEVIKSLKDLVKQGILKPKLLTNESYREAMFDKLTRRTTKETVKQFKLNNNEIECNNDNCPCTVDGIAHHPKCKESNS